MPWMSPIESGDEGGKETGEENAIERILTESTTEERRATSTRIMIVFASRAEFIVPTDESIPKTRATLREILGLVQESRNGKETEWERNQAQ